METPWHRTTLGSSAAAETLARRTEAAVSAYAEFLQAHGFQTGAPFTARPPMDKQNYLSAYPFTKLLGDDWGETFTIFKSSGSSGLSFYWPQLKYMHRSSAELLRTWLEAAYRVHERRTLAIVGLALGSWIGGEHFSWVLKSMALETPYPFSVFSPGSCHDEIIEMCRRAGPHVDQLILFVCPSAIGHLLLRAEQAGWPLPLEKLRYVVLGEPFPESLRGALERRAGLRETESLMLSVYGSADTGALGFESPASVALRKLLSANEQLAGALDFRGSTPHFFHAAAPDAFLESIAGELCVTRWQGIPLVRYNVHDSVRFLEWKEVRARVLAAEGLPRLEQAFQRIIKAAGAELPDLLAIAGRSDQGLILCGTNISETMLDAAVRCPELSDVLTGAYKARIRLEEERQFLEFDLEFRTGAAMDAVALDTVYHGLVQALGQAQPEFLDDWRNVYRTWDDNPAKRILRLHPLAWPALSERTEKEIKQRGTRP